MTFIGKVKSEWKEVPLTKVSDLMSKEPRGLGKGEG